MQTYREAAGLPYGQGDCAGLAEERTAARPQFRFALQRRLRKEFMRQQRAAGAVPSRSRLVWLLALLSFLIIIPSVAAYAFENPHVTRGTTLYLVKQLGESFQASIDTTSESQVDLYFHLAQKRLDEAKHLAEIGVVDVQTLAESKANVDKGMSAARILEPSLKPQYADRIAGIMRGQVGELKSLSVVAQAKSSQAIIVNGADIVALTPRNLSPSTLPPSSSQEMPPILSHTPVISPHPAVNVLNDIIVASEKLTNAADVLIFLQSVDLPVSGYSGR